MGAYTWFSDIGTLSPDYEIGSTLIPSGPCFFVIGDEFKLLQQFIVDSLRNLGVRFVIWMGDDKGTDVRSGGWDLTRGTLGDQVKVVIKSGVLTLRSQLDVELFFEMSLNPWNQPNKSVTTVDDLIKRQFSGLEFVEVSILSTGTSLSKILVVGDVSKVLINRIVSGLGDFSNLAQIFQPSMFVPFSKRLDVSFVRGSIVNGHGNDVPSDILISKEPFEDRSSRELLTVVWTFWGGFDHESTIFWMEIDVIFQNGVKVDTTFVQFFQDVILVNSDLSGLLGVFKLDNGVFNFVTPKIFVILSMETGTHHLKKLGNPVLTDMFVVFSGFFPWQRCA
ncbi:hypothetical protein WICPIJ_001843 [Wickerhamomyces pijperi]|uniref:Uncharacterized protein n=1 Tax=Wickerhamomyces pijperi TaxID=599730 RepID=A0A9P8TQE5_WICPI|nr:hypothetical protein WICPIJ_001843 [Wickerhamomyces pijperi]